MRKKKLVEQYERDMDRAYEAAKAELQPENMAQWTYGGFEAWRDGYRAGQRAASLSKLIKDAQRQPGVAAMLEIVDIQMKDGKRSDHDEG